MWSVLAIVICPPDLVPCALYCPWFRNSVLSCACWYYWKWYRHARQWAMWLWRYPLEIHDCSDRRVVSAFPSGKLWEWLSNCVSAFPTLFPVDHLLGVLPRDGLLSSVNGYVLQWSTNKPAEIVWPYLLLAGDRPIPGGRLASESRPDPVRETEERPLQDTSLQSEENDEYHHEM